MNWRRKRSDERVAAEAERRQREDDASRLSSRVPNLTGLRLRFSDERDDDQVVIPSYVKPVIVGSAPAHFEIRCMDANCDGTHELTRAILEPLLAGEVKFSGTSPCNGMVGDNPCQRVLGYGAEAKYSAASAVADGGGSAR